MSIKIGDIVTFWHTVRGKAIKRQGTYTGRAWTGRAIIKMADGYTVYMDMNKIAVETQPDLFNSNNLSE